MSLGQGPQREKGGPGEAAVMPDFCGGRHPGRGTGKEAPGEPGNLAEENGPRPAFGRRKRLEPAGQSCREGRAVARNRAPWSLAKRQPYVGGEET